jgi:mannose-6-phosphate isomerase-like protein (cupin superfamily)
MRMKYVRPVDESGYQPTGLPGFEAQFLAVTEAVSVAVGRIACGGAGPALHIHPCDQYYFMCRGSMKIQLRHDVHDAGPGSLVHIPAGVPHCNWNVAAETEVHLELLAPTVRPGQTHFTFVDSVEDAPPVDRAAYVSPARAGFDPGSDTGGIRRRLLSRPEPSEAALRVTLVETAAQCGSDGLQIHDADQLLFVLDGAIEVTRGFDRPMAALAPCLVLLPAGVPYRVFNTSATMTSHLEMLALDPGGAPPRGQLVSLEPAGSGFLL